MTTAQPNPSATPGAASPAARPPALTDRVALAHHRRRAAAAPALFLHESVADELELRLGEVNRRFTAPAIVTGAPDFWARRWPAARVVGDEDTLALEPGAHDLVIHALALHWADDPVGQLVQCRHALRPDGLFLAAMFGGRSLSELRAAMAAAELEILGGMSPRVLPMAEIRDLGALLQRAGFALPVADSDLHDVRYRDSLHLMHDLRAMGETNALSERHRRPPPRRLFSALEAKYRASFTHPQGGIAATFEVIYLTGWAPDPGQPQPLRPGSAQQRLADALGTAERPLLPPSAPGRGKPSA